MTTLPASPAGAPAFGFYGDDFTGATDTLAHLARAGLRVMLFLDTPTRARLAQLPPLDALGVAGTARALAPPAMQEALTPVGARFAELGVRIMHYKVCSTFDSAPSIGSIGAAIATLHTFFPNRFVPIVGGQPDLQRYCVFGHLFAAAGATRGEPPVYRIDRHPTMSHHPVTPMGESDLRQHLLRQGLAEVGSIDWRWYARSAAERAALMAQHLAAAPSALLFDVMEPAHLLSIGHLMLEHAAHAPLLAVGASSVAQAYAMALEQASICTSTPASVSIPAAPPRLALGRAIGPVFALAGSLSPLTAMQIEGAHSYQRVELDPASMFGATAQAYLATRLDSIVALLRDGKNVLAYTVRTAAPMPGDVTHQQRAMLAKACAVLLQRVVNTVPLRRIGIAGGDTSSFAVLALRAWGLSYLAPLSSGVTVCRLHADEAHLDGLEVMLKGGQMGDTDLFEQLIAGNA